MTTVTFQQGVNGYTGTLDTMIQQATPTTAYGTSTKLSTDTGTNANVQTLLTFDGLFGTGLGQIPLGATITSATLTLQTTNGSAQGASLHRMVTNWMGVPTWTWDSFNNGIQFDGTEAVAAADVSTGAVGVGSRDLDVTKSLQAWSDGASNYGWAFMAGGTDGWDFYSAQGATKPKLTVTYTTDTPTPPAPTLAVSDVTVTEGGAALVTVSLSGPATGPVSVAYGTAPGSAVAGSDYTSLTGTLNFATGETSKTVSVATINDTVFEPTESFNFNLSSPTGATIADGTGVITITDNDSTTPPPVNPAVVAIHNTTLYKAGDPSGYGCSDPSGLAYVPGLDLIFIADSEHDESPFFSPTNLFAVRPDGTHVASYSLTSFCKEPTGLAYNPNNGYLYITDDDQKKVFWVDPKNPSVKIGEFSVKPLGIADAEDPKFDPVTGHMYMVNGLAHTSADNTLFELTDTGQLVRSVKLPSAITDAEALAYDSTYDVFFIASGATRGTIFQMSSEGQLLGTIDLLNGTAYRNPINGGKPKIKGLELALSSDPHDGNTLSLYAADYGGDQANDGRLFEISLGTGWLIT
jgi:hypothetical protein